MRSTSPPAGRPPEPSPREPPPTLLDELLCVDGVTDLAVYRLVTGRAADLLELPAPEPPGLPEPSGQLGALFVIRGGA